MCGIGLMKTVNLWRPTNRPFLLEVQHVLSREGMGSHDKRLHCVLDWGYMGDLGMSKETGGPAFPIWHETSVCASGMSIRDYFAGVALQGMITTSGAPALNGFDGIEGCMARAAYRMADEMLKYRGE